jgi:hypothetical protein
MLDQNSSPLPRPQGYLLCPWVLAQSFEAVLESSGGLEDTRRGRQLYRDYLSLAFGGGYRDQTNGF